MKIQLAVFLCSCAALTLAAPPSDSTCTYTKPCPVLNPMKNIDYPRYAGIWREYYHGKNVDYQCGQFTYDYQSGSPAKYSLTTDAKDKNGQKIHGTSNVILGKTCMGADYMNFVEGDDTKEQGGYLPSDLNIFVLDTDYDTYTVEYGCSVKNGKKDETLCVQSRVGKPALSMDKINKILKENNIDQNILTNSCPNGF